MLSQHALSVMQIVKARTPSRVFFSFLKDPTSAPSRAAFPYAPLTGRGEPTETDRERADLGLILAPNFARISPPSSVMSPCNGMVWAPIGVAATANTVNPGSPYGAEPPHLPVGDHMGIPGAVGSFFYFCFSTL